MTMSLASSSRSKRVVSLEAFIIDTVLHQDSTTTQDDQIGGAGTYAMAGARMFLPPSRLGMIVNYSPSTLPEWMVNRLKSFGEEMWYFKERHDGLGTTRSVQTYQNETLVDPILCTVTDLLDSPFGESPPTTLHLTSLLNRTIELLQDIEEVSKSGQGWEPIVVWEPYYADSIPTNLDLMRRIVPQVDIFSPNHLEALSLCSQTSQSPKAIEEACTLLAKVGPKKAVVIRAGAMGACYALSTSPQIVDWIPAYWTESQIDQVVDVTGAGNGFLGGLCAGLDEGMEVRDAVVWASVAASLIVQQVGLPVVTKRDSGSEMWNGASVHGRVEDLIGRT